MTIFGSRYDPKKEARQADADLRFLTSLRSMELDELFKTLRDNSHSSSQRWKQVAVRRAISRIVPHPLEWVLGLDALDVRRMSEWQVKEYAATVERLSRL